jgi:hypothetical protein
MNQENFLYFGRRPTNVCYNGTSFPVMPGDVVRCYKEFWEAFIPDERLYKVVPNDDAHKPKYTFGRSPVFVKHDPTGGLPVRADSSPGANPRLREKMKVRTPRDPALVMDAGAEINPYDIGVDNELTVDISTSPELPSAPEPKSEDISTGPSFVGSEVEEEIEEVEEETKVSFIETLRGRTVLRKLTRDEVFAECKRLADTGCPSNTEKLDAFVGYDEDTTRGVMFKELWDYCGYNE